MCGNRFQKLQVTRDSVDWHSQGCYVLAQPNAQNEYTKLRHQFLNIEAPCHNTA